MRPSPSPNPNPSSALTSTLTLTLALTLPPTLPEPSPGAPKYEYEDAINFAVFPSLQGGPHNHQIAGLATQLKEVATPEFKAYAKQVRANAQALAKFLTGKG